MPAEKPESKPEGALQIDLRPMPVIRADFANVLTTTFVNESAILTFGYFDPLAIKRDDKGAMVAPAQVFSQIAAARSSFSQWLVQTVGQIASMPAPERESLGWAALVKAVDDAAEQ